VYPLAPVDAAALKAGIQQIGASGGTPLGERMKEGCDTLLALRDDEHYGSYRLLIVTDGEATDGKLVEEYLPDILSRGIWVGVIGVDMAGTHSLATKVHTYRRADDPQALVEAIREFMAEYDEDAGADQLDVALLAAIPDEVATAALKALSEPRNHPIGAQPSVATPRRQQEGRPGGQEPEPGEQGIGFLGCCCWGVVVLFIVALVVIIRAASKPKRS
ncbi:MAG: hypothetical protein HQ582_18390, partial [Planctomycetes bacterium]|nr:hypothetical protein [Planctomycetota bacterium]